MDLVQHWWPLIAAGTSFIVWVVRMEGKMLTNAREIERLWQQRRDDMEAARTDRQELKDMLKDLSRKVDRLIEKRTTENDQ